MLHNEYVLLLMFAYFHLSDIHALYLCWDPFADGQPVEWIMWPKAIQFSLKIAQYSAWDAGTWKLYLAVLIKWGYNCKVWSVWRCSYPQHPNPLCSLPGLLKQVEKYACGGSHLISGVYISPALSWTVLSWSEKTTNSVDTWVYTWKNTESCCSV